MTVGTAMQCTQTSLGKNIVKGFGSDVSIADPHVVDPLEALAGAT